MLLICWVVSAVLWVMRWRRNSWTRHTGAVLRESIPEAKVDFGLRFVRFGNFWNEKEERG